MNYFFYFQLCLRGEAGPCTDDRALGGTEWVLCCHLINNVCEQRERAEEDRGRREMEN